MMKSATVMNNALCNNELDAPRTLMLQDNPHPFHWINQ